jgi:CheY-like chemotaxis protein
MKEALGLAVEAHGGPFCGPRRNMPRASIFASSRPAEGGGRVTVTTGQDGGQVRIVASQPVTDLDKGIILVEIGLIRLRDKENCAAGLRDIGSERWREEAQVPERAFVAFVDDDEAVCDAMLGLLRVSGFRVQTFSSAEEFLNSGRLDDTSCLITDVQLNGMSGLALQNRLVELNCRIPVIMITAFPEKRIRDQALSAGAVGFLGKPVAKADLLACIDSALAPGNDSVVHS